MKINSDLKQQRFYRYEEFIKHYSEEKVSVLQKDYYFSEEYTKLFDIQGQMIFKDIDGIGIQIKIIKNSAEIDLCDIGYGYSKLLPILYLLWIKRTEATWEQRDMHFILEEPESNLHPSLQSRLGDFFTSLIKDNIVSSITKENKTQIGLIIETHSEYLIRKLQYLTAKGELKTDDTVIYYFYHPDKVPEGEKQVYKINIDDRGRLTKNFGEGFFDVAGELEFLLYSNTN